MVNFRQYVPRVSRRAQLGLGAAVMLAVGGAAGASAVEATRPSVEMAPVQPVAIASLPQRSGLVTVKGRVAEVYGDRFTVSDGSGKTMVDAGREGRGLVSAGAPVTVQGRYDDGQLHASFLVDGNGQIDQVAPPPPPPGRGPRGPHDRGPGFDGPPPPPPGGPGAVPPPPGGPGAPPPPPPGMNGCAPAPQPGAMPPAPPAPGAQPGGVQPAPTAAPVGK